MSPRTLATSLVQDCPVLHDTDEVAPAVRTILESGFPALPVVDERERLVGLFGEREFIGALFPAYVKELSYAGFVPRSIESVLEKRARCRHEKVAEHMNTEHVDVPADFADVQLAETFLHHRVLIIPVTEDHRVVGLVTRSDFFAALADRFLET